MSRDIQEDDDMIPPPPFSAPIRVSNGSRWWTFDKLATVTIAYVVVASSWRVFSGFWSERDARDKYEYVVVTSSGGGLSIPRIIEINKDTGAVRVAWGLNSKTEPRSPDANAAKAEPK